MYLPIFFDTTPQWFTTENLAHVPSAITNVLQIPVSFQLNDNALNCKVTYAFRRIFCQTLQYICMIRQKVHDEVVIFLVPIRIPIGEDEIFLKFCPRTNKYKKHNTRHILHMIHNTQYTFHKSINYYGVCSRVRRF